jgi:hypothetical protein
MLQFLIHYLMVIVMCTEQRQTGANIEIVISECLGSLGVMLKSSDDSDFDDDYEEEENHRADNDLLFRSSNVIIPRPLYKCYSCEPPDCRQVGECHGAFQVSCCAKQRLSCY